MKFFTLLLLCTILTTASAQRDWKMDLGINSELSVYPTNTNRSLSAGINFDWWLSDRFALNYQLNFGRDDEGKFYLNTGMGQLLGWYMLLTSNNYYYSDGLGATLILCLIIPEGVSFNLTPKSDKAEVLLYADPVQFDYLSDRNKIYYVAEAGLRLKYIIEEQLIVGPKLGFRYRAVHSHWGVTAGLHIAWRFNP